MIKKICFMLFYAFLLLSFVSSLDIDLEKSSFYPAETLQAEISGAFISPMKIENIGIYEVSKMHEEPSIEGLIKIGTKYLYYSSLPIEPGQYVLRIEGVDYYIDGKQTSSILNKNFSIKATNSSYLSVLPGFIYTSKNFDITIKAYNKDQSIKVEFEPIEFSQTFNLGYNEEKKLYFSISELKQTVSSELSVGSYSIPVYVILDSQNNNTQNENESGDDVDLEKTIELSKDRIEGTLLGDTDYYYTIELINLGSKSINIDVKSDNKNVKVKPEELISFDDRAEINITINSKKSFNSTIDLIYGKSNISIPIKIIITKSEQDVDFGVTTPINKNKTCEQLNGVFCDYSKGQTCTRVLSSVNSNSYNQICCSVACTVKKSSSTMWIWGLLLLAVLVIGGWLLYKKSKEENTSGFSREILSKRIDGFNSRMNPKLSGKEVSKNLSKD